MSSRIDYKVCCDEITRICAKLDEYIRNFPGVESTNIDTYMAIALSQAIADLHTLEKEIDA